MRSRELLTPVERAGLLNILGQDYQDASDKELYNLVQGPLSEMTPEQAEDFWSSVLDIGKKALPGVIQGFTTGMATGGPWAGLAGAAMGGISSALSGGQTPQTPRQAPSQPPTQQPMPQIPMAGAGAAQPPAAAQLLQLINSPLLQQALASLVMGAAGRQTLPVGGKQVPTADFANTLGVLAQSASREAAEAYAESPAEAYIPAGSDPANPEHRARALMGLLPIREEFSRVEGSSEDEFYNLLSEGGTLTINFR